MLGLSLNQVIMTSQVPLEEGGGFVFDGERHDTLEDVVAALRNGASVLEVRVMHLPLLVQVAFPQPTFALCACCLLTSVTMSPRVRTYRMKALH